MAMLVLLAVWVVYLWLARGAPNIGRWQEVGSPNGIELWEEPSCMEVPHTVPSEWVEAYRAETDT